VPARLPAVGVEGIAGRFGGVFISNSDGCCGRSAEYCAAGRGRPAGEIGGECIGLACPMAAFSRTSNVTADFRACALFSGRCNPACSGEEQGGGDSRALRRLAGNGDPANREVFS
jgi:hypothetical protein